jgi:hypothetical protein
MLKREDYGTVFSVLTFVGMIVFTFGGRDATLRETTTRLEAVSGKLETELGNLNDELSNLKIKIAVIESRQSKPASQE